MQGNDPFAFRFDSKQVKSKHSDTGSLITLERSQKLDLLIHLISNLSQSLVISGPKGIGKTTLLNELKTRKNDVWPICTLQASEKLSFESIQNQIRQFLIQQYPQYQNQELPLLISAIEKQNQKIVILIDDAGRLVPGLISSIIQYAATSESLRFVLALTPDELHLKSSSDSVIDDCHFIEIPPLTEKQCGIFLQNLSAKVGATLSFSAINERMIERVYQKTHGIPGEIVNESPKMSYSKVSEGHVQLLGVIFLAIFVVIILKFYVFDDADEKGTAQVIKPIFVQKKAEKITITPPVIDIEAAKNITDKVVALKKPEEVVSIEPVILKKSEKLLTIQKQSELRSIVESLPEQVKISVPELVVAKVKENIDAVDDTKKQGDKKIAILSKVPEATEKEKITLAFIKDKPAQESIVNGREWVLSQPEKNYTIQLMVLSSRKSVNKFLTANQSLKQQLKFFQPNKQNQKYVIIYGSFKNTVSAINKMKSLPAKYRKSWIRKISDLQKGIKK
ncbi:MAG: ATP-binding protein [Methylococcales bacterium]